MRRENKRKGLNRLLVLVLAAVVTMAFSFTSISFAAEEGEGTGSVSQEQTQEISVDSPLPQTWSNITLVTNTDRFGEYDIDKTKKLDVVYKLQNPISPYYGQLLANPTKHIVLQTVTYNGVEYKIIDKKNNISDTLDSFTAEHPGKGYIYTKWDNDRDEKDVFSFYTKAHINWKDVDTDEVVSPWPCPYTYELRNDDKLFVQDDKYDVSRYAFNYKFNGYRYVKTEGNPKGKFSDLTGAVEINVLYKKQFTVTYKDGADGKVFSDQTETVDRNAETPAFEGKTEREGYSFIGWDKEIAPAVTDNIVYTAQWKENSAPYVPVTPSTPTEEHTVTFHPNNGESNFTQTVPDGGKAVQPEDPAQEGYTFDGWFTDSSFTQKYDFNTPVKGNIDLYAKWNKVVKPVNPVKPVKPSKKVTGILLPKVIAKGKHTQTLTWTALKNVDGYFIYTNHCDEAQGRIPHPFKKVADYKASKARVYTKKNLKTYHNYKYYVAAYKIKNGKKVIVRNSVTVHSVCGNTSARSTNVKSVKVSKHAVTLKKGQTYKVKASISKLNKKRAFLDATHCGLLRYLTADSKIATVNYKTGVIKAKKAGKTTVYVLGVNGIRDKVTVTVK